MTKHGHGLPRKKPDRPARKEIDDALPELEQLQDEELPELELVSDDAMPAGNDGPVRVTLAPSTDQAFDTVITVDVAAMDKKAVPDAVRAPLTRAAGGSAEQLRHRRVLVRFTGDTVIGSAVKDLVAELMKANKPLLAVVRRGFGDETIAQGKLPEVAVVLAEQGDTTRVEVATNELDAADLPAALAPHVASLAATARGRRFTFAFTGKVKPDAALRTHLTKVLRDADALRAAIGERVLFDRELADRVRCTVAGDVVTVVVTPAADDATTVDALSMVLPEHAAPCKGRTVRIELTPPSAAASGFAVEFAKKNGAARIELGRGGAAEVVWPKLITVAAGADTTLRLLPNGRDRAAVLAALRAECSEHAAAAAGNPVVLDWPAGFVLDAEAEGAVRDVVAVLAPKALACTVGGEQREPFEPPPVAHAVQDGAHTIVIDGEAGKPIELQRALDRRLPAVTREVRGKAVRLRVTGAAAVSRTLLRGAGSAIEAAGAMRLEVEEGGNVDVWLPPMLTVAKAGDNVRITAVVDGRDGAQQTKAMQRELDAAAVPKGARVTIGPSVAADALVAAMIARGASRVTLDGQTPLVVHPPLFACERRGANVRVGLVEPGDDQMVARRLQRELQPMLRDLGLVAGATVTIAWQGGDPASEAGKALVQALVAKKAAKVLFERGDGVPRQVHPPAAPPKPAVATTVAASADPAVAEVPAPVAHAVTGRSLLTLLARRDDAVPPVVLLGVEHGNDEAHLAAVEAQLQEHLPRLRGRSVLLVLRAGDQDVPVRKPEPLVELLRRVVPATAAATLVFRGPDAQGRPHFQVLHSTLRALPVGATFGDPRLGRGQSPVSQA